MEYKLLEASNAEALTEKVQSHLGAGWQLQGGVAVATYGAGNWWYYQAVTRRDA